MRPARNWARPAMLGGGVVLAWAGAGWRAGIPALAVLAVLLAWSAWRHPWRPCWRCRGSGARYGPVWQGTAGRCKTCEGEKQQLRWTVRFLTPGRAARLLAGDPGRYG